MTKLYEYQLELLNSKEKEVEINWCRGAGKDFALAMYIIEHKPSYVLWDTYPFASYVDVKEHLQMLQKEFNFSFEPINREDYKLHFLTTGKEVQVKRLGLSNTRKEYCDLLIVDLNRYQKHQEIEYNRLIKVGTKNTYDEKYKANTIVVDYKRAVKGGLLNLGALVELLLDVDNHASFYRDYALLDKPKGNNMSFDNFATQSLQKLQKQFLNTADTKDTVLTRKTILDMIKDLVNLQRNI